jgi:hypothetical protein
MLRLNPIWTAGRLNEALEKVASDAELTLGPDGSIETISDSASMLRPDVQRQRDAWRRECRGRSYVELLTASTVFDGGLRQLPPVLAFLSINPEPWCSTNITSGALESIGSFLDYPNPLWEWLVRGARAGRARILPSLASASLITRWCGKRPVDKEMIPLPQLVHNEPSAAPAWLRATLSDFELSRVFGDVKSATDATAVAAGLMELHDLGESHELAQSIEGRGRRRAGDYWHAIHHRREPDPSNAKYWLRKVGSHPIHESLAVAARSFLSSEVVSDRPTERDQIFEKLAPGGVWDSFAFVDFCARAIEDKDAELAWAARQLQFLEMTLLLDSAYEDATT